MPHPGSSRFALTKPVRDFEATLSQQILNIAEAQRKAAIEPHGVLNNIGRKTVAAV